MLQKKGKLRKIWVQKNLKAMRATASPLALEQTDTVLQQLSNSLVPFNSLCWFFPSTHLNWAKTGVASPPPPPKKTNPNQTSLSTPFWNENYTFAQAQQNYPTFDFTPAGCLPLGSHSTTWSGLQDPQLFVKFTPEFWQEWLTDLFR